MLPLAPLDSLTAGIVTPSYRGDLAACRTLCRSIDRFAAPEIKHLMIVPKADLPLFAELASPRRQIITAESIQPWWLIGLPMPSQDWCRRLHLPRREVLFNCKGLPVRGWIVQQLRKVVAATIAPFDLILFIDSDNVMFRPLRREHYFIGERIRFFRNPGEANLASHNKWHHAAARLLGLPDTPYFGADYIDPAPFWQKRVAEAMTARIAEVTGIDWRLALARSQHLAEYILYGVYSDHILGEDAAGHTGTTQSLAFSRWSGTFQNREEAVAFLDRAQPHHIICNLQSTMDLDQGLREELWHKLIARAEAADQARS